MPLRRALTPGGRRFLVGATAAMLALPPIALLAMRMLVAGSDVAALGLMLYELVLLERPYPGKSVTQVIMRAAEAKAGPIDPDSVPAPIAVDEETPVS